jgi:hypothetical protein
VENKFGRSRWVFEDLTDRPWGKYPTQTRLENSTRGGEILIQNAHDVVRNLTLNISSSPSPIFGLRPRFHDLAFASVLYHARSTTGACASSAEHPRKVSIRAVASAGEFVSIS